MPKKKFKPIPGGYVALPWNMLNSKAYRELSPITAKMLPFFLGKVKIQYMEAQYHYIDFTLSYTEAAHRGCSRRSFSRIIAELVDVGFIDPVSWRQRTATIFHMSKRWEKYGTAAHEKVSWEQFRMEKSLSGRANVAHN
jgi:hypothetical protein